MSVIPFIDLQLQTQQLAEEIHAAMSGVLKSCDFICGSALEAFERDFAQFLDIEHAVGVGTGVDALRLALMTLDIGPEHEVILPANTFIATALAVSAAGAKPVLVDCDERTYNIDVAKIERAVTRRTRAIMPVHFAGQSADMDAIVDITARHNLFIIEDACQAHGATYRGQACGTIGDVGCFSFYPGKNLGAFGDGGIVVTGNGEHATRIKCLRNYGQREKYHHVEIGLNTRLDTLQAAILQVKLRKLAQWNAARRRIAEYYHEQLRGVGDIEFQHVISDAVPVYHLLIVRTDRRDELRRYLGDAGIQTGVHYPVPVHLQPAYATLGYVAESFPVSERLAQTTVSLPMYPELKTEQIDQIVRCIKNFYALSDSEEVAA